MKKKSQHYCRCDKNLVHRIIRAETIDVYHFDPKDKQPDEPFYMGYIDDKDSVDVIRSIYEYRRTKRDFKLLPKKDEKQRD